MVSELPPDIVTSPEMSVFTSTSRPVVGALVPIPIRFASGSTTKSVEPIVRPPANVEVASPELATKFTAVSCPADVSFPSLRKKRSGMRAAEIVEVEITDPSAFVAKSALVKPVIAKLVEVADVSVVFPENVLLSARSVEEAAVLPMQIPLIETHPPLKLRPFAKVLVAELPVMLRYVDSMLPAKVDVEVLVTMRLFAVVVPTESVPSTSALPVVVAPPRIVSPPVCVPSPMVDDACEMIPLVNVMRPAAVSAS